MESEFYMTGVLIRTEETQTHSGRGHVMTAAEIGGGGWEEKMLERWAGV